MLVGSWRAPVSPIFVILDLGDQLGGTSISGQVGVNGVAFPWGAHYINTPPMEADCILEVLEELQVVVGYTPLGWPSNESRLHPA